MGVQKQYLCPECNYAAELEEGCGMSAQNRKVIQRIFSEEERMEFEKLLDRGMVKEFQLKQETCICKNCKELVSVASLDYKTMDEVVHSKRKECPDCHRGVQPVSRPVVCPRCGKIMLEKEIGKWD